VYLIITIGYLKGFGDLALLRNQLSRRHYWHAVDELAGTAALPGSRPEIYKAI
jgi:hypothetical protein